MYNRNKSIANNIISCINDNIKIARKLNRNNSYVMTVYAYDFGNAGDGGNKENLIGYAKIVWDYCKNNKLRPILTEWIDGNSIQSSRYIMVQLKPNFIKRMIIFPLSDLLFYLKRRHSPIVSDTYSNW